MLESYQSANERKRQMSRVEGVSVKWNADRGEHFKTSKGLLVGQAVLANRANFPIQASVCCVRDALSFPEGFGVSKKFVQWFMQSTKLRHNLRKRLNERALSLWSRS